MTTAYGVSKMASRMVGKPFQTVKKPLARERPKAPSDEGAVSEAD